MKRERRYTRKKTITRLLALLVLTAVFAAACGGGSPPKPGLDSGVSKEAEESSETRAQNKQEQSIEESEEQTEGQESPYLSAGFSPAETQYIPVDITPNVREYSVSPDLSNIVNLSDYPLLTAQERQKIAENGFVVIPSEREQLFYIYETNEYGNEANGYNPFSGFVTTDSVLHLYHIFFDYALRTSEAEKFFPATRELNSLLLENLISAYPEAGETKTLVEKAIGYFGVAAALMGESLPADTPSAARELIRKELELIERATEAESPLMGIKLDYSQLTVRGHYTRTEALTNYFKAMMWYGLVPFRLYDERGERDENATIFALVIAKTLFDTENGAGLWESVYSPTCFFVGNSDDITPHQYKAVLDASFGANIKLSELSDQKGLDAFYKEADKLPKPRINAKRSEPENTASGIQFRFMGQRYIPDSEILQELSEPLVRPVPSGLDVFSVLGSERANELNERYNEPSKYWPEYTGVFQKMRDNMAKLQESVWQSNLYYGWLWVLKSLTGEYGKGWPLFMQNAAWQDKSLATGLGSWAELRHDTILYGKQSGAEKGGMEPEIPPSYVEPNAELYNKMLWLVRYSKENLRARDMLQEDVLFKMESFEDMLDFLLQCSIKELRGEDLSDDDNRRIIYYGGWLERQSVSFVEGNIGYWYEIESETDRNMAVIADVHTVFANEFYPISGFLEEAVGSAAEIYVAVPAGREVYLARGAVFDYYEFVSEEKRLTDEEWQSMLKSGEVPERPPWVNSFMAE